MLVSNQPVPFPHAKHDLLEQNLTWRIFWSNLFSWKWQSLIISCPFIIINISLNFFLTLQNFWTLVNSNDGFYVILFNNRNPNRFINKRNLSNFISLLIDNAKHSPPQLKKSTKLTIIFCDLNIFFVCFRIPNQTGLKRQLN